MTHLGKTVAIVSRHSVIREAPESSSIKISSVNVGDELLVTGTAVNGWYPVNFNNVDGYVYGRYVSISNVEPVAEEDETSSTPEEAAENAIQKASSDMDCSPVIDSSYEAYPVSGVDIDLSNNKRISADGDMLTARKGDSAKENISATVEDIHNRVNDQEAKHLEREEKKSTKKKKGLIRTILDLFGW